MLIREIFFPNKYYKMGMNQRSRIKADTNLFGKELKYLLFNGKRLKYYNWCEKKQKEPPSH
jgi:hypothetical protein